LLKIKFYTLDIKKSREYIRYYMNDIEIIWLLLGIGYGFGFCIIAYFGITGTNEAIDFQNRMREKYKDKNDIH